MAGQTHELSAGRQRGRTAMGLAVAFYGLAGLVALAAGAWLLFSTTTAMTGGCYVILHLQGSPLLTLGSQDDFLCEQTTDLLGLIVPAFVAATLLPTALRLRRNPPRLGPVVAVGVVVGLGVAALPLAFILWALDFYGFPPGPLELVIFAGPFLWALVSAVIVARRAMARERPA